MLKVALFEDQPLLLKQRGLHDQLVGHELVASAETLAESFDVLKQMALGELAVDAILLDAI